MVLQRKGYSLFLFRGDVMTVEVIDGERKARRMRQHVCYGCPTCANKGKTQIGCRIKNEVSPSTTDLY
jgi:hypothetical protein